jgi:hypothetical protein
LQVIITEMLTRGSSEPESLTCMYMNISGTATNKIVEIL